MRGSGWVGSRCYDFPRYKAVKKKIDKGKRRGNERVEPSDGDRGRCEFGNGNSILKFPLKWEQMKDTEGEPVNENRQGLTRRRWPTGSCPLSTG